MKFFTNMFTPTMADVYSAFTLKARKVIERNTEVRDEQNRIIEEAQDVRDVAVSEIEEAEKFIKKFTD